MVLAGKTVEISVKTCFFFGDHLFLDGKALEISVKSFFFAEKTHVRKFGPTLENLGKL